MNFIYNIFSYIKNTVSYYTSNNNLIEDNIDKPNIDDSKIIYFFINTSNIINASKILLNRLNDYKGYKIKIYLLKSHTLEPLCDALVINDDNINLIEYKLSKKREHLKTLVEAIDSFIEYNNIRNYHIFY